MGLFNWIKNVFSSDATKETNMLAVSESEINKSKKLRDESIITNSQLYIKQIRDLTILTNKTIYHDKFKEVLELTSKIHDKIIETEKVSINRLEQFHKYFSDEFVNTFDDALDDLRPKKEVDEKLKASFIIFPKDTIVTSVPSRFTSARPIGIVYSPSGTSPLSPYICSDSMKITGSLSRIADFKSPLAS